MSDSAVSIGLSVSGLRQSIRLVEIDSRGYASVMRCLPIPTVLILCVLAAGCDSAVESFPPNRVQALVVETSRGVSTENAASDATVLLKQWFGTPESPRWPVEHFDTEPTKNLVDPDKLLRASGRVYSDEADQHFGLYREHCVTCHGVSGGGDGPASLLQNPYPRDLRAGVFKWKSTERAAKPTRSDLMLILEHGAPGSGMPSFQNVAAEDLDALVDYIIFLSVRGEFERRLLYDAVDELDYGAESPGDDASLTLASSFTRVASEEQGNDGYWVARDRLNRVVQSWIDAEGEVAEVPPQPENDAASVERGRDLFHGQIANCAGCHGKEGAGGVDIVDFDDWTKEFTTRLSITPSDRDAVRPFRKAGALRPRQIHPRKLAGGFYRGGGDGKTLYRRLTQGIAGTPMPSVMVAEEPSPTTLTASQVWDLVHYVQSLAEEKP
ncbi:MAG: cytochrome c [Planctomycetota bacterium]